MSPQLRGIGFTGPQQQRGAIGLMAAVTLGMVLLFMLLVVDSGRLYLEQRKLQRVADMAVLEAVSRGGTCGLTLPNAQSLAEENAKRNNFIPGSVQQIAVTCGTLKTDDTTHLRKFTLNTSSTTPSDAIRVIATTTVPTSVAGGLWSVFSKGGFNTNTNLTASAVGTALKPLLAQISIRSTLLTIKNDSDANSKATLLNSVFGALLGGKVDLTVGGWNGLINSNINLLKFMDQAILDLNLTAGDYEKLLSTKTTVAKLLAITATVANANGPTADLTAGLTGLVNAAANVKPVDITLGELLNIATGAKTSGLDANLQVAQLIQAFLQVANTHNAVDLNVPIVLPGVASATLQMKVIEPPQFSAIGDPSSGQIISVRTAQVRSLIAIDLTGLGSKAKLPDAITGLTDTLLTAVNDALHLNLVGLVSNLLCLNGCKQISPRLLPDPKIYINIDAGGAEAKITNYSCPTGDTGIKSLTVSTTKSLADLRIGKTNPDTVFSSKARPEFSALPIIDIGIRTCYKVLGLLGDCTTRVPFAGGGVGIMTNLSILETADKTLLFSKKSALDDTTPPNLTLPPAIQATPKSTSLIDSLSNTIAGVKIQAYTPTQNNIFSALLTTTTDALSAVRAIIDPIINLLLKPLLTPLINNLLTTLGISLVDVEIGANLTCGEGGRAQLVL